ncbi:MAG TPA: peptidylprolyl isomerase, partial [Gemmatimonadaceae bacterium]|nr:peptidylprolyl isomerase [Gemmatimonadaceae bacterium]
MLSVLIALALQSPAQQILEAEHNRARDLTPIQRGLASQDSAVQRVAVRAAGRLGRPELKDAVLALTTSRAAAVRREAFNALGQLNIAGDYSGYLAGERDGSVRGAIHETIGRITPPAAGAESQLSAALGTESDIDAARGAARGIESLFRLNRSLRPADSTIARLHRAFRANTDEQFRELVLLTLNAAQDHDPETLSLALKDSSPQVRRLAVVGGFGANGDPSPMVRYEIVRLHATCEQALTATRDSSELVALAAVDVLGMRKCAPAGVTALLSSGRSWRIRAHAIVALARVAPDSARALVAAFARDTVWQVRVYAATASKLAHNDTVTARLARDPNPNVAAEAMTTVDDAIRALGSSHAGLLVAAARRLKGAPDLPSHMHDVLAALRRLTTDRRAPWRDPRVQLLERVREAGDADAVGTLRVLLNDVDPAVASLAADILTQRTGTKVEPVTKTYAASAFPSEAERRALDGAVARVSMKGGGTFTLELMNDDAPATVATFAALAARGAYNGTTFHRMVPNFVIQGGSPGADEYDGATAAFMRDEIGLARNARGSVGISTRGLDTGDGQIYVNLVDNFRLDHSYTIFARVASGMNVVDRILEGDVIESVKIER